MVWAKQSEVGGHAAPALPGGCVLLLLLLLLLLQLPLLLLPLPAWERHTALHTANPSGSERGL